MGWEKKDNDNSRLKLFLRRRAIQATGKESPSVLDLFAGNGIMWKDLPKSRYTACEKDRSKNPFAIHMDNLRLIPNLDLSTYDIVDLDAYGTPDKQLLAIEENGTMNPGTVVVYTMICTPGYTSCTKDLASIAGIDDIKKRSEYFASLCIEDAFDALLSRFTDHVFEVRQENLRKTSMTKRYGYFIYKQK